MKISLIGSGKLGLPLAKQLIQDGHQLLITTTQEEKLKRLQEQGFNACLYRIGAPHSQLFDCQLLIIITPAKDLEAVNRLTTHFQPELATLFTGSTSVYQDNGKTQAENSSELVANHPLLAIEQRLQKYSKCCILRLAGLVADDRQPGNFLSARTITAPQSPVNLIHIKDCIAVIRQVIEQQHFPQLFNVCADQHPPKGEFYTQAAEKIGVPPPIIKPQNPHPLGKIIDNQKLKTTLNYQPKHSIFS